jgi:dTDP-4-amino-4,6-dideoxygalactose transaminase
LIRLSKSSIGPAEQAAVSRVLDIGFLGTGPETRAFEQELEAWFGGGVSVACVNTGTAALHLALQAVGVGNSDEVLVPSLTYVACFQAISACGATPVACDVHESTGLLDLSDAAARVTPRTKAIMPVHYASSVGDLDAIHAFGRRHGLRVVEDAAHAFGCEYKGRKVGTLGDVACFSFDGIKNITSGEGGAVVSVDRALIAKVQDARLLGIENDTEQRYKRERSWEFDVRDQGWRYHMSDVMAAIGRVQLARFDREFKPVRVSLAKRYQEMLRGIPGLRLLEVEYGEVVPHIFPLRVLGGMRDRVRRALIETEIQVGIHYKPNHLLSRYGGGRPALPVAERLYEELLTLPLHADLTAPDVERVVAVVQKTLT